MIVPSIRFLIEADLKKLRTLIALSDALLISGCKINVDECRILVDGRFLGDTSATGKRKCTK